MFIFFMVLFVASFENVIDHWVQLFSFDRGWGFPHTVFILAQILYYIIYIYSVITLIRHGFVIK